MRRGTWGDTWTMRGRETARGQRGNDRHGPLPYWHFFFLSLPISGLVQSIVSTCFCFFVWRICVLASQPRNCHLWGRGSRARFTGGAFSALLLWVSLALPRCMLRQACQLQAGSALPPHDPGCMSKQRGRCGRNLRGNWRCGALT